MGLWCNSLFAKGIDGDAFRAAIEKVASWTNREALQRLADARRA